MDLIPKPDQVVAAANNLVRKLINGSLADRRPMPRMLIDRGSHRSVYRYELPTEPAQPGEPVLLIAPLGAPASCYDLRRGGSLVERLVDSGRPTYLVEYGDPAGHDLDPSSWVEEVLPAAVRTVHQHSGGRPVHLLGWGTAGNLAVFTAAAYPQLPLATLSILAAPFALGEVPVIAPAHSLFQLGDSDPLTQAVVQASRALATLPPQPVRELIDHVATSDLVAKPVATVQHLDDADWLAQVEATQAFTAQLPAYPGRTFGQLYHRVLDGAALEDGVIRLGDREVRLDTVTVPTLVLAGNTDGIAPVAAVKPVKRLLSTEAEVRFEIVPGGHLGMITGRAARATTWVVLEEWWDAARTEPAAQKATAKKAAAKKTAAKKSPTKKPAAKKTAAKKTAAKKSPTKKPAAKKTAAKKAAAAAAPAIGANRERRYGSASSRRLGRG